jgi:hypothetical protein
MKKMVTSLALVTAFSALASDPKVFTGRYKSLSSSDCDIEADSRVYVSQGKSTSKSPTIIIQSYKEDASFSEIPTESRRVQTQSSPDTSYTETTKVKWASPTSLKVSISTQGKNFGKKLAYTYEHTLVRSGKKFTFTTSVDGRSESRCDMIQY